MTRGAPSRKASGTWRIFRWPIVIAIASIAGLVSALVGDGWPDIVSWLLLGALIIVMAAAWLRGRR